MSPCTHYSSSVRPLPSSSASFHRSECTQCFDGDGSTGGLMLCLTCFNGGCTGDRNHSLQHFQVTGHSICLNIVKHETAVEEIASEPSKITKLAIGVSGGASASPPAPIITYDTSFYCHSCKSSFPVDDSTRSFVDSVLSFSSSSAPTVEEGMGWEDNPAAPCKHTDNIEQMKDTPQIDTRKPAKCSKCDVCERLWLCLSCGHLGCSRRQYGDENSGNEHGIAHFEETGHSVVLKLGTIKPDGTADLYCYGCDSSVLDRQLASHLSSFGINIANEEATEKSTAELQLESNLKWKWSRTFDEDGKELEAKFGPGYCGLENLGNSCYLASIVQVLFALPQFQQRYLAQGREHILTCRNGRPADCFLCQMAKLADGLYSGRYSKENKEEKQIEASEAEQSKKRKQADQPGVPPRMFKRLIARDHPEFSRTRQQDALEFLQYFLKQVQQREKIHQIDPTNGFQFKQEEKLQCLGCRGVKYSVQPAAEMSLNIPVGQPKLVDNNDAKKTQRKEYDPVPMEACLDDWSKPVEFTDYRCAQCSSRQKAVKQTRFLTYPDTLVVHMRRFVLDGWVPEKLDCDIIVNSEIELENLRAMGKQPNETLLPQDAAPAGPQPNEAIVSQLEGMGFSRNASSRAALAVNNSSVEAASEWIFSHMDDADLNDPISQPNAPTAAGDDAPADLVMQLESMGFPNSRCKHALKQCQNNLERAVEWLFSHMEDDIPESSGAAAGANTAASEAGTASRVLDSAPARYRLFAYVTHLGNSTGSGHYVACILKEGKWVLFNDSRVTLASPTSTKSAPGKAYLYFFRRIPG